VKFKTLGRGYCKDSKGAILPRYYADVLERDQCERQCRDDVQCVAYSYGYYVCSIYGRMRTRPPHWEFWGDYSAGRNWAFEPANLGTPDWIVPAEYAYDSVGYRSLKDNEAVVHCYIRGDIADEESSDTLMKILALVCVTFFVIVFPSACLFCSPEYLACVPCRKRCAALCCHRDSSSTSSVNKAADSEPKAAWAEKPVAGGPSDKDPVLPFEEVQQSPRPALADREPSPQEDIGQGDKGDLPQQTSPEENDGESHVEPPKKAASEKSGTGCFGLGKKKRESKQSQGLI
jgi:hypothetical protein